MGTYILLLVFGVFIQFYTVLGRHNFYEYYYSRHHKGHSTTTESVFSSTLDILASSEYVRESSPHDYISREKTNMISTPDGNSLHNNRYEVTDDASLQNDMYETTVYENYNTNYSSLSIGVIIAGVAILLSAICCVLCCICQLGRRKERRGFVIGNHPETAREVVPQQNALIHQTPEYQQPYQAQYYDERSQFFPPPYQSQPVQQFPPMQPQFQYSPHAMQSHNPPEAPPPYEFPDKF